MTTLLGVMVMVASLTTALSGYLGGPLYPFLLFGLLAAPLYVHIERGELAAELPGRDWSDLVRTGVFLAALDLAGTVGAYYLGGAFA